MMKLCALFAVASAYRTSELGVLAVTDASGVSTPEGDLMLVPGPEFETLERPVLSHQMEIKPGEADMVMEIQEMGSGFKAMSYEMHLVQKDGKVQEVQKGGIGTLKSKSSWTKLNYNFQPASKTSSLRLMLTIPMRRPLRAYVTSSVKKNPYTYYTFAMLPKRGRQEAFGVFKGMQAQGGFLETPYLEGVGHFLGNHFQFFMAGQAEPVAVMQMIDNKFGKMGIAKQRYSVKMQSGVDPLMLSMLIGFIDACNNGGN